MNITTGYKWRLEEEFVCYVTLVLKVNKQLPTGGGRGALRVQVKQNQLCRGWSSNLHLIIFSRVLYSLRHAFLPTVLPSPAETVDSFFNLFYYFKKGNSSVTLSVHSDWSPFRFHFPPPKNCRKPSQVGVRKWQHMLSSPVRRPFFGGHFWWSNLKLDSQSSAMIMCKDFSRWKCVGAFFCMALSTLSSSDLWSARWTRLETNGNMATTDTDMATTGWDIGRCF